MLASPRRVWFLKPGDPLCCADGHVIRWETQLLEDGFPRCTHRSGAQGECPNRVYVLILPRRVKGRPLILVAEITGAEIKALLESSADVEDVLDRLGLVWSHSIARQGIEPPTIAQMPLAS